MAAHKQGETQITVENNLVIVKTDEQSRIEKLELEVELLKAQLAVMPHQIEEAINRCIAQLLL